MDKRCENNNKLKRLKTDHSFSAFFNRTRGTKYKLSTMRDSFMSSVSPLKSVGSRMAMCYLLRMICHTSQTVQIRKIGITIVKSRLKMLW